MATDTFMRVVARGIGIEAVANSYAEWALGLESPRARRNRRAAGIREQWTIAQVVGSESLIGDYGCRVDVRRSPERMLFRFVHRDAVDGSIFWQISARVQRDGDAVVVEHGVGRDAPRNAHLTPVASPSRVVLGFLDQDGVEISPRDLALPPVTVGDGGATRFVEHVLLRHDRELPMVVVACDRDGEPPLVDIDRLAKLLRGMCAVAVLPTAAATFEFGDALEAKGFEREFRCYHGAVHTYGPAATMRQDHRLWLGDGLRRFEPAIRSEVVAGLLAHRIAVRETPPGFFTLIEDFDREERRGVAKRLSEKRSTPPPPSTLVSSAYHAKVEAEKAEVQAALARMVTAEQEASAAFLKSDEQRRTAEQAREDAEAQLEQERAVSAEVRDQMQRMKAVPRGVIDRESLSAVRDLLEGSLTPLTCLSLLRLAYADRIVVLDTALASAERSQDFRASDKLLELLRTLATGYWEALAGGKGDGAASKAFSPNTFASNESETTRSNNRAIKERSFTYGGHVLVMWRHLRIGNAETTAETIRVHFDWVQTERRIVIGWCGEHRYRVM